jgi:hypothetical protein
MLPVAFSDGLHNVLEFFKRVRLNYMYHKAYYGRLCDII